jgi:hypothetical protein
VAEKQKQLIADNSTLPKAQKKGSMWKVMDNNIKS